MTPLIWLLPIFASCLGAPKNSTDIPKGKIVGGLSADIEFFPYQLSLQYQGRHHCGASIIHTEWAVTAAHCTNGVKASDLSVRSGSSFHKFGGQVVKVLMIIQHRRFNHTSLDSDISLLLLETEIRLGPKSKIIKLIDDNVHILEYQKAVVSGWGATKEGSSMSERLQFIEVPIVDHDVCKLSYPQLTDNMICAGYMEGRIDSCQGDSGGPLVINDVLVGIVSFGKGCARRFKPGVYTNVSAMRAFIKKYTRI